eukprot:GGOE01045857.1.p1 GENE.GGOE01045857.1~~GGOE01045857.1.p1  ORF type:complete len:295 (-),score=66.33 GGOE01045857.1:138-1022(-)
MFYDLNVLYNGDERQQRSLAAMAQRLGYSGIAWNYVHSPHGRSPPRPCQAITLCTVPGLKQLRRITLKPGDEVTFDDVMRSPTLQQYDLVAVEVAEKWSLLKCIDHKAVDIVSLDWNRVSDADGLRWPFQEAIQKGISFELTYNPALCDPLTRVAFSQAGQRLSRWTRCRNLVLSSGAADAFQLRAPLDVASMAILFAVDHSTAQHFVGSSALAAVKRAAARHMTIPFHVQEMVAAVEPAAEAEDWVVDCSGFSAAMEVAKAPPEPLGSMVSEVPGKRRKKRKRDQGETVPCPG